MIDGRPKPYYVTALEGELMELWGEHVEFGTPESIGEMCGYRMLTSFYDDGFREIENRRELLYHNLKGIGYSDSPDGVLEPNRSRLPVDSFLPKVVKTLSTAYAEPPTRTWTNPDRQQIVIETVSGRATDEGGESPETTILREIVQRDGIDGRLQDALRYAKLESGCIVGAYVGARGRMQVQILTLDLCRYRTDPVFPDHLTQLVLPLLRRTDENGEPLPEPVTVYQVWTDTEYRYTDADGKDSFFFEPVRPDAQGNYPEGTESGDVEAIASAPNNYGRIPFVIMRLAEPNSMDTFSGGLFWIAEANLRANAAKWNADLASHYESHGHWVAQNMKFEGTPRLGVGGISHVDGVKGGDGEDLPPSLTNVAPNGYYQQLDEFRRQDVRDVLRLADVPESQISEQSGNPPSGVARRLERMGLIEQRRQDVLNLQFFEQEFWDMLIRVLNIDARAPLKLPLIPEGLKVEVTFADENLILEPKDDFELATIRFEAGAIDVREYVKTATGKTFADNNEAAQFLIENKAMLAAIDAGVLPSDTIPTPPAPAVTDDTETEPTTDPSITETA